MKTPSVSSSIKTDSSDGSINIAIACAMNGNVERFMQCFDNENDPFRNSIASLINTRSTEDNKSALDWASLIGNFAMVSELIKRGADVNAVSEKGRLHYCREVLLYSIFMATLWNRAGHYIFKLWFLCSIFYLSSFFSLPNLSGRRLDVYHTSTHGVALMRI